MGGKNIQACILDFDGGRRNRNWVEHRDIPDGLKARRTFPPLLKLGQSAL